MCNSPSLLKISYLVCSQNLRSCHICIVLSVGRRKYLSVDYIRGCVLCFGAGVFSFDLMEADLWCGDFWAKSFAKTGLLRSMRPLTDRAMIFKFSPLHC